MTSVPGSRRRGAALVMAMVALLVVSMVAAALVQTLLLSHRQAGRYADRTQAEWLAEAGLARARAQLAGDDAYRGETWLAPVADSEIAEVSIRVEPATDEAPRKIVVRALYPPAADPQTVNRQVLAVREQILPAAQP
ncbi:MAG: PilX N-terminal domain-containing pilus assembly protein [Pirellulaceae bacterium]